MSMAPRLAKWKIRWTRWAGHSRFDADVVGLPLEPDERARQRTGSPWGTAMGRRLRPERLHRGDDLGDDVAGLADDDRVALPHVLAGHLLLVVQRGPGDGRPAHEDRGELGEGGGAAGPADADEDPLEDGGLLLGRELEGDGPAGRLAGGAHAPALVEVVDLDDGAVDLVAEVVAVLEQRAPKAWTRSSGRTADPVVDREAGAGQPPRVSQWLASAGAAVEGAEPVAADRRFRPAVIWGRAGGASRPRRCGGWRRAACPPPPGGG